MRDLGIGDFRAEGVWPSIPFTPRDVDMALKKCCSACAILILRHGTMTLVTLIYSGLALLYSDSFHAFYAFRAGMPVQCHCIVSSCES